MTPTVCYDFVKKSGINYATFGVQNGNECWAARRPNCYAKYGKTDRCKAGAGGPWALSVYKVKEYKEEPIKVPSLEHLGCWKDQWNPRALPKLLTYSYSSGMTAEKCAKLIKEDCSKSISDLTFFGIQVIYPIALSEKKNFYFQFS